MKKEKLKEAFRQLAEEHKMLIETKNNQFIEIKQLRDSLHRAKQLAEDYRVKLIKNTNLTLDQIDGLTEEEVFEKMERGYKGLSKELHEKIQPKVRRHIVTEPLIQSTDDGEYIPNPIPYDQQVKNALKKFKNDNYKQV